MNRTKKEVVFIIEYRVDAKNALELDECILTKLRETGAAEVIDVRVEENLSAT